MRRSADEPEVMSVDPEEPIVITRLDVDEPAELLTVSATE
jgi:hypothetical protein